MDFEAISTYIKSLIGIKIHQRTQADLWSRKDVPRPAGRRTFFGYPLQFEHQAMLFELFVLCSFLLMDCQQGQDYLHHKDSLIAERNITPFR